MSVKLSIAVPESAIFGGCLTPCYSRTATIVFLPSLVCLFLYLFVWMFVCPSLFLDSIHSTVTMLHVVVTKVLQMKPIEFGIILVQKGQMRSEWAIF